MAVFDAAFAAAGGATSLALAAALWALAQKRSAQVQIRALAAELKGLRVQGGGGARLH